MINNYNLSKEFNMSTSVRGTITRPNLDTVWPFYIFFGATTNNFFTLSNYGATHWVKGDPTTDLVLVVDHYYEDDNDFNTNKAASYEIIPLWKNSSNANEVESYQTANNVTVVLEEVTNPDLSGFIPLTSLPIPQGLSV